MNLLHLFFTISITFIFLKVSIPSLKRIIPANPTIRGMHKEQKASSGGILFILIYIIYASYQEFYLPFFSIPISIGFAALLSSFLVGVIALKWLLNWLGKGKFHYFGIYCILLGLLMMFN